MTGTTPYAWLALDLETADGRPEDLERWFRLQWSPSPKWKPETVGTRFHELHTKKLERLALLDESPVTVIALRSNGELRALHQCYAHPAKPLHGGLVEGFAEPADMLVAFRNLIEACASPETVLVGHNLAHFDLPKLRWAFLKHGVRLPAALVNREQPIFDSMLEFARRFSINKADIMIGLDSLLEEWGIPSHKQTADGAMAPELYATGQHDALIGYALLDVIAESEVFLRMTGQAEGLR